MKGFMPNSDKFKTKWRYEPLKNRGKEKYEGCYYNWINGNELGVQT